jgi:hypothetical protein
MQHSLAPGRAAPLGMGERTFIRHGSPGPLDDMTQVRPFAFGHDKPAMHPHGAEAHAAPGDSQQKQYDTEATCRARYAIRGA